MIVDARTVKARQVSGCGVAFPNDWKLKPLVGTTASKNGKRQFCVILAAGSHWLVGVSSLVRMLYALRFHVSRELFTVANCLFKEHFAVES